MASLLSDETHAYGDNIGAAPPSDSVPFITNLLSNRFIEVVIVCCYIDVTPDRWVHPDGNVS